MHGVVYIIMHADFNSEYNNKVDHVSTKARSQRLGERPRERKHQENLHKVHVKINNSCCDSLIDCPV